MPNGLGSFFEDFVALFFPSICIGCEESLPQGVQHICPTCQYQLPKTNNYKIEVTHIEQILAGSIHYKHLLAYLHFHKKGIVQKLLHELKYNHKEEVGIMLGRWFGHDLMVAGFQVEFDLIVPVPLHTSRQRKRGYNQSEAFAKGLSEVLKTDVVNALARIEASETQTRKTRMERQENVKSIFEVILPSMVANKRVLLVDDVLTTGATLIACGEQLQQAGITELSIGVIAATQ
ncbi:MAG: ComF family protein [Roseivirga sp.]|jgi:ComF family protein